MTSTLRGKVEFESGEEGREIEILAHLLRTATAETFRARLAGLDLSGFVDLVADGEIIETGELVPADELLRQVGTVPGLAKVLDRLGLGDAPSRGAGGVRRRVRPRRAAPDPPAGQGRAPTTAAPCYGSRADDGRQPVPVRRCGAAGPTRSPRRTTCGPRSTRSASEVLAGGSLRDALREPAAARAGRPAAAWTTCATGPAGCAGRRCAAAGWTAR